MFLGKGFIQLAMNVCHTNDHNNKQTCTLSFLDNCIMMLFLQLSLKITWHTKVRLLNWVLTCVPYSSWQCLVLLCHTAGRLQGHLQDLNTASLHMEAHPLSSSNFYMLQENKNNYNTVIAYITNIINLILMCLVTLQE